LAACTSPAGIEGTITWNGTDSVIWCNGTTWYALKDAAGAVAAGSTGQIQFNGGSGAFSADSSLAWDNTNKRLGIGTATPRYPLHVGAGANTLGTYNGNGTTTFTPQIVAQPTSGVAGVGAFVNNGTNNRAAALFMNDTDTLWGLSQANSSGGAVPFIIRQHSTGEVLRIDSNGNVGIGTTAPATLVEINKGSDTATGSMLSILQPSLANGNYAQIYLGKAASTNNAATISYVPNATSASSTLRLGLYNSSDSLVINGTGNVGIGTTNPAAQLHLAGNASAPAWTINGIGIRQDAATYTDTTSTGIANIRIHLIGQPTIAASNTLTVNAATFAVSPPLAGANVTLSSSSAALAAYGSSNVLALSTVLGKNSFTYSNTPAAGGLVTLSGSGTVPSWSTTGTMLAVGANTMTDSSGTGTIAVRVANSFSQPTFASSSAVTLTNAATVYIADAPAAGTNTTITNAQALHVAAGNAYFGGNVGIGVTAPSQPLHVFGTSLFQGASKSLRIVPDSTGVTYIQVGADNLDASAVLRFTRYATAGAKFLNFEVVADNLVLGSGEGSATPAGTILRAPNVGLSGNTDTAGAGLTLQSGLATGSAASGDIIFKGAPAGSSGTTLQTAVTYMTIKGGGSNVGNVGIGTATPSNPLHVVGSMRVERSGSPSQFLEILLGGSTENQMKFTSTEANKKSFILSSLHGGQGSAAGALDFVFKVGSSASPTEVMRIKESGNVGIGTATPAFKLDVAGDAAFSSNVFMGRTTASASSSPAALTIQHLYGVNYGLVLVSDNVGASSVARFDNPNGNVGSIVITGTTTTYTTSSDRRLKENIGDAKPALARIMDIPVHEYSFKLDPSHKMHTGFIAQELEKEFPEAVVTNGDDGTTPLSDSTKAWSVDYGRVTPLLLKAVQELKAANDNLQATVEAQGAEIEALKAAAH
jgi:hypothetical protein